MEKPEFQRVKKAFEDKRVRIGAIVAAVVVVVGVAAVVSGGPASRGPVDDPQIAGTDEAASVFNWDYDDDRTAVTIGDTVITEGELTQRVAEYRVGQGLADDDDWQQWLESQGTNAESIRSQCLNEAVEEEIVRLMAVRLRIEVTDEDVQAQVDAARESFLASLEENTASADDEDDSVVDLGEPLSDEQKDRAWANALAQGGYTPSTYEEAVRTDLIMEQVMRKLGSDAAYQVLREEILEANPVSAELMPEGMPYDTTQEESNDA